MNPPEKPLPTDCCGTGCVRCVYDIYFDELTRYNAWLKAQKRTPEQKPANGRDATDQPAKS